MKAATATLPHGAIGYMGRSTAQLPTGLLRGQSAPAIANAPGSNGAIAPRLVPALPMPSFDIPGTTDPRSVPGALVVIAVTAVAALGASHIGVWQNRLRSI